VQRNIEVAKRIARNPPIQIRIASSISPAVCVGKLSPVVAIIISVVPVVPICPYLVYYALDNKFYPIIKYP